MTGRCLYCDVPLGRPSASRAARQAYDPERGRLWNICAVCGRWNPVPLELRWERLEGWERRVRDEGEILLAADQLALVRVGGMEVVRVGDPNFTDWGGWRYGTRLPLGAPRPNLLERALGSLPPAPIEGYDPYGLTGPLGGGGG